MVKNNSTYGSNRGGGKGTLGGRSKNTVVGGRLGRWEIGKSGVLGRLPAERHLRVRAPLLLGDRSRPSIPQSPSLPISQLDALHARSAPMRPHIHPDGF